MLGATPTKQPFILILEPITTLNACLLSYGWTRIIGLNCMHASVSFTVLRRAYLQAYTNIGLSLYSLQTGDNRVLEASTTNYLKLL